MSEEENEDVTEDIKRYFEGLSEFMKFKFVFLKNFSSGNEDRVEKEYADYREIIEQLKNQIANERGNL